MPDPIWTDEEKQLPDRTAMDVGNPADLRLYDHMMRILHNLPNDGFYWHRLSDEQARDRLHQIYQDRRGERIGPVDSQFVVALRADGWAGGEPQNDTDSERVMYQDVGGSWQAFHRVVSEDSSA